MTDNAVGNLEKASPKSVLFVFASSPQSGTKARDGVDTLLAYAAFEQPVAVLFHGEGVWQLQSQQQPELADKKSIYKSLMALPMYDVSDIFIHRGSVVERGLLSAQLSLDNALTIDDEQMRVLLRQYSLVMRF